MERVREAINRILGRMRCGALDGNEWTEIKAAILAAHPGEDEITAAMGELGAVLGFKRPIWLERYADGRYTINIKTSGKCRKLGCCADRDELPAAIRALLPKPEPTVAEEWETVRQDLIRRGLVESNLGKAIARLRENWEQS